MKNMIKKFFENKFNLAIVILQVLAFVFLALSYVWDYAMIFMLVLEGGVFVTIGIKTFFNNRLIDKKAELMKSAKVIDDSEKTNKKIKITKRSNILQGILYICMGLILAIIALF